MEEPSNKQMKNIFQTLETIQKVDPSEELFEKIQCKIEAKNQNVISLSWLRAAEAVIVCFVSVELYFLSTTQDAEEDLSSVFLTVDNSLYDE